MKSLFFGEEVETTVMFGLVIKNCLRADGSVSTRRLRTELRSMIRLVAKLLICLLLGVCLILASHRVLFVDQGNYLEQDYVLFVDQQTYENQNTAPLAQFSLVLIVPLLVLIVIFSIYSIQKYRTRLEVRKEVYERHDAQAIMPFRN